MNRIDQLFKEKNNILNIYFTAGFPALTDTTRIIKLLESAGADMIEIGIPYSDPLADGPTIQESNEQAIQNGMTMHVLFDQLKDLRSYCKLPIVLMGYINPVMQYGIEEFLEKCAEIGIDGTILPDMPFHEYEQIYKTTYQRLNLHNIFLITPQTSPARIRMIDEASGGFIYMVSSDSITGAKEKIANHQVAYFERVNQMQLRNPRLIGFGISNYETYSRACAYSQGAIIGSAFIRLLKNSNDIEKDVTEFVRSVKHG
jgi:tryptophan synthase alpha chain